MKETLDAVVVGAGPNGLAAAITLAETGKRVLVVEAHHSAGGGARSAELTLPGFIHDTCSAVHPMAPGSRFFRERSWTDFGLCWRQPEIALAHPLEDGSAAALVAPPELMARSHDARVLSHGAETEDYLRSVRATAETLGPDAKAYTRLFERWAGSHRSLLESLLGPLLPPKHPFRLAGFGRHALLSAERFGRLHFRSEPARALFAGAAAHSLMPLDAWGTTSFGLVLLLSGHVYGWPSPQGGAGQITQAMVEYFRSLGGELELGRQVERLEELPGARAVLFDVGPPALAKIARGSLPPEYTARLRSFAYGPGVFKVDWALDGPIPWTADACRKAGTVHVGGTLSEITASERAMARGEHCDAPFVLVAQQSLFDERAPPGKHTGWAYCHVPQGSTMDRTDAIERQVERFAPGFVDLILARHTMHTGQLQAYNPNLVGGDVGGGRNNLLQLLARPALRWDPYSTPNPALFLCSASTPPGGGVHGMCGHLAALAVLKKRF